MQYFLYLRERGMLRWYLTTAGLTAFNQPLTDQELSGFFLIVYPSEIEWNSMILNPLQTGFFRALYFFNISDFYHWWWWLWFSILSKLSKFWTIFILNRMRVSASCHWHSLLVEGLGLLFYYWTGKSCITTLDYFQNFDSWLKLPSEWIEKWLNIFFFRFDFVKSKYIFTQLKLYWYN